MLPIVTYSIAAPVCVAFILTLELLRDVRRERGMTQLFLPHCHLSPPFRGPERGGGEKKMLLSHFSMTCFFVFRALEGEVQQSTEAEMRTRPPQYGKLLHPLASLVLYNVCLQQTASSLCVFIILKKHFVPLQPRKQKIQFPVSYPDQNSFLLAFIYSSFVCL